MHSALDSEGHHYFFITEIIDHRKDDSAVTKENGFTRNHYNIPKKTTKGWEVLIEWKDETTSWVDIKDVKEERTIYLDEYALANMISDESSFAWWVP